MDGNTNSPFSAKSAHVKTYYLSLFGFISHKLNIYFKYCDVAEIKLGNLSDTTNVPC